MAAMRATSTTKAAVGGETTGRTVTYRPIRWADLDAITDEFERTWGHCSSAAGTAASVVVSRHFVLHYLEPATGGIIAEIDGRPAGTLIYRVPGAPRLFAQAQELLAQTDARLEGDPIGARSLHETLRWHRVETDMESANGIDAAQWAEIELFLVAASARGHGIGGGLWRRAMDALVSAGVERFFLHTDSSCDVGFYDHQGLDRVAERFAADHRADGGEDGGGAAGGGLDDLFIYAGVPGAAARPGTRVGIRPGIRAGAAHIVASSAAVGETSGMAEVTR